MKQSRSLAVPDIDPDRVFRARLFLRVDLVALRRGPEDSRDARQHHRWACYPYCDDNVDPSVPTLALIAQSDDCAA